MSDMKDHQLSAIRGRLLSARLEGLLVELDHRDGRDLYGYEIGKIGHDMFEIICEELDHKESVMFTDILDLDFV